MWRLFLIFCLGAGLSRADARDQELKKRERSAARKIYQGRCAKCHRLYEPRDYAQDEWRLWMVKMSKKAKLSAGQDRLLNRYLDAYRAEKPSSNHADVSKGRPSAPVSQTPQSPKTPGPHPDGLAAH